MASTQTRFHAQADASGDPGREEAGLGPRLRAQRHAAGFSLARLALATGLTKGYLSKIERAAGRPSIGTVFRIAEALQVPAGQLLAAEGAPTTKAAMLARAGQETPPGVEGLLLRPLFPRAPGRLIALEMWPPLEARTPADNSTHAGEEFLHVLSGRMEITFDEEVLVLEQGDSLRFDARRPHRTRSLGTGRARVLVVLTAET